MKLWDFYSNLLQDAVLTVNKMQFKFVFEFSDWFADDGNEKVTQVPV